jgi:hypothetical protein
MIPIQSVFEDMRQTFGGSDIRLASKAYGRFIPQSNTSTTVDVKKERLSRPEDYSYPRFSSTVSELQSVLEGPSSFGDRGTAQAHTVSTGGRLSPVLESLIPTSDSTGNEVTGGLISWFIQKISDSWGFKGKGRSVPHHKDYQNLRRVSVELDQWSANAESEGIFSDHAHSEADIHKPLSGSKKFIAYRDHSDSCLKQNTFAGADFNKLAVTFTLCIAHMLTELEWQRRGALSEIGRRLYTMTTTVISIALVLNLTSAAKGVALKLRWPFLAGRYSNMIEVNISFSGYNQVITNE